MTSKRPKERTFSMMRLRINSESSTTKTRDGESIQTSVASAHQVVAERIRRKLGIAREIHFFENARTIGTDGLDAQAEFITDVGDGLACRELHEYLELARRKLPMRRL